jgi:hypothetical protein
VTLYKYVNKQMPRFLLTFKAPVRSLIDKTDIGVAGPGIAPKSTASPHPADATISPPNITGPSQKGGLRCDGRDFLHKRTIFTSLNGTSAISVV